MPIEIDLKNIISQMSESDSAMFNRCYQMLQHSIRSKEEQDKNKFAKLNGGQTTTQKRKLSRPQPLNTSSRARIDGKGIKNVVTLKVPRSVATLSHKNNMQRNKLHQDILFHLLACDSESSITSASGSHVKASLATNSNNTIGIPNLSTSVQSSLISPSLSSDASLFALPTPKTATNLFSPMLHSFAPSVLLTPIISPGVLDSTISTVGFSSHSVSGPPS